MKEIRDRKEERDKITVTIKEKDSLHAKEL
jgi:hypothetical protein